MDFPLDKKEELETLNKRLISNEFKTETHDYSEGELIYIYKSCKIKKSPFNKLIKEGVIKNKYGVNVKRCYDISKATMIVMPDFLNVNSYNGFYDVRKSYRVEKPNSIVISWNEIQSRANYVKNYGNYGAYLKGLSEEDVKLLATPFEELPTDTYQTNIRSYSCLDSYFSRWYYTDYLRFRTKYEEENKIKLSRYYNREFREALIKYFKETYVIRDSLEVKATNKSTPEEHLPYLLGYNEDWTPRDKKPKIVSEDFIQQTVFNQVVEGKEDSKEYNLDGVFQLMEAKDSVSNKLAGELLQQMDLRAEYFRIMCKYYDGKTPTQAKSLIYSYLMDKDPQLKRNFRHYHYLSLSNNSEVIDFFEACRKVGQYNPMMEKIEVDGKYSKKFDDFNARELLHKYYKPKKDVEIAVESALISEAESGGKYIPSALSSFYNVNEFMVACEYLGIDVDRDLIINKLFSNYLNPKNSEQMQLLKNEEEIHKA